MAAEEYSARDVSAAEHMKSIEDREAQIGLARHPWPDCVTVVRPPSDEARLTFLRVAARQARAGRRLGDAMELEQIIANEARKTS